MNKPITTNEITATQNRNAEAVKEERAISTEPIFASELLNARIYQLYLVVHYEQV